MQDSLGATDTATVQIVVNGLTSSPTTFVNSGNSTFSSDPGDGVYQNDAALTFVGNNTISGTVVNNGDFILSSGSSLTLEHGIANWQKVRLEGTSTTDVTLNIEKSDFRSEGTLEGVGTINLTDAKLQVGGDINPGFSPGTLQINGETNFNHDAEYNADIASAVSHDQINVNGNVSLGGELKLNVTYSPSPPDTITLLTGTNVTGEFSNYEGLDTGSLIFVPTTNSTSVTLTTDAIDVTASGVITPTATLQEVYAGSAGNDSFDLTSLAAQDTFYGRGGDDTFQINDNSFARIDGGDGNDTLELPNNFSLTGFTGYQLDNIELLDIKDAQIGTLTLDFDSAMSLRGAYENVEITADAFDNIVITADSVGAFFDSAPTTGISGDGLHTLYLWDDDKSGAVVLRISENAKVTATGDHTTAIYGSILGEVINGTTGSDSIVSRGGGDTINAGDGGDMIGHDPTIVAADGGTGRDVLVQNGVNEDIDLVTSNPYTSIEEIDLRFWSNGQNALTLDVSDVTQMGTLDEFVNDGTKQVLVRGTGDDNIILGGQNLSFGTPTGVTRLADTTIYGETFAVYQDIGATTTLFVEADILNISNNAAVASGIWNSTSTWNLGTIPISTDDVVIPTGITVTAASGVTLDFDDLTIDNGTLDLTGSTLAGNQVILDNATTLKLTDNVGSGGSTSLTVNSGTVELGGTSSNVFTTLTINGGITNAGLVDIGGGTLGISFDQGSDLIVNGPGINNLSSGTLKSSGTADNRFLNADVQNAGLIDIDYPLTHNGDVVQTATGVIDVDANYTINAASNLNLQLGTIDIGSGATLTLHGGTTTLGNQTTLQGDSGTISFSGNQTVNLSSDFTFDDPDVAALFPNTGLVTFNGAKLIISGNSTFEVETDDDVFNNDIQIDNGSTLTLGGTTSNVFTSPTFNGNVVNAGTLEIGGGTAGISFDQGSHLIIGSGLLTNQPGGVLRSLPGADDRQVSGNIDNQGSILVDYPLTYHNSGDTLNNSSGTINAESNLIITGTAGTIQLGTGSTLSGNATIFFNGTQTIDVVSDFTFDSNTLNTNFTGGQTTFDDFGSTASFINTGHFLLQSNDEVFNLPVDNQTGGLLDIGGTTSNVFTSPTFNDGITNTGIINIGGGTAGISFDQGSDLIVNGSGINNLAGGKIQSTGTADNRFLTSDIQNAGIVDINYPLTHNGDVVQTATGLIDVDANYTINTVTNLDLQLGTIDIGSGATLTLHGGTTTLGNQTTLQGDSGTISFSGNQTVTLSSDFTFDDPDVAALFPNTGLVTFNGAKLIISGNSTFEVETDDDVFNSEIQIDNGATLTLGGTTSNVFTSPTFNGNVVNAGTLEIGGGTAGISGDQGSHLVLALGELLNQPGGVLRSMPGTDNRQVSGEIDNQGSILVDYPLTYHNSGNTLDSRNGTINAESNLTITGTGGTIELGSGTVLSGNATIFFNGTQTIDVVSDLTFASNTLTTNFTGGQTTFDDFGSTASFINTGHFLIQSNDEVFNLPVDNQTGGLLDIGGTTSNVFTAPTFNDGITNTGIINIGGGTSGISFDQGSDLIVNGSGINNLASGTIQSTGSADNRFLTADVQNAGTIDINYPLTHDGDLVQTATGVIDVDANYTINTVSNLDLQLGLIDIGSGATLTLHGGTTALSNQTTLQGDGGTISFSGNQTVNLSSDFTFDDPDVVALFPNNGLVTFNGAKLIISGNSTFEVETDDDVFNNDIQIDNGSTLTLGGTTSNVFTSPTFNGNVVNAGTLEIGGGTSGISFDQGSHLVIGSGLLINQPGGVVRSLPGADDRQVSGNIDNQGSILVDYPLTYINSGDTLDNSSGTINVESNLTITGTGSTLSGNATIFFNGTQTIDVASDYTFTSNTLTTNFNGGQTTFDDFGSTASFINTGHFLIQSNDEVFNLPVDNQTGGLLDIGGATSNVFTSPTFNEGINNTGVINIGGGTSGIAFDQGSDLIVNGGINNLAGGTIQSTGSADNRFLTADVQNAGTIDVNYPLAATGNITNQAGGLIDLDGSLSVTGQLTNNADIDLGGSGALTSSAPIQNNASGNITLNSRTLAADVINDGAIIAKNGSNFLTGNITSNAGSLIKVDGDVSQWGDLEISNGFVNNGDIIVDHSGVSNHESYLDVTSGNLTISGNATLQFLDTGGALTSEHEINAEVINNGQIDVDQHTVFISSTLDTSNGAIEFTDAQILRLNGGVLKLGSSSVITGNGAFNFSSSPDIDLVSQFNIAAGQPGFDLSNGAVDFTGTGPLVIDSGQTLTLDTSDRIQTPVNVDGTLVVKNGSNDITSAITTSAGSQIIVDGDASQWGDLDVSTGFVNNGDVILDHSGVSNHETYFDVATGNFAITGNATFQFRDTGGALTNEHRVTADLIHNTGQIDVDQHTVITANVLDNSNGTIEFTDAQILRLNGVVLRLGSASVITGNGTLNFSGSPDIDLLSQLNISAGQPTLDLSNGSVDFTGAGPLVIDSGETLTLDTSDRILTPVDINGSLVVKNGSNDITGNITTAAGSQLIVDGDASQWGDLDISNGFVNNGDIILDHTGVSNHESYLEITSGNLTITGNATLQLKDTGGALTNEHQVDADIIINDGQIDVDQHTRVTANLLDSSNGTIDFTGAQILKINGGVLGLGSASVLTGNGAFNFTGSPDIDLDSQFNISAGQPAFDLSNGSVDFTGAGSLVIDAGQTLALNLNDNIHTPVSVDGTLLVKNGSNNITGTVTTAAGSQIIVDGDASDWGDLDISTGFVNNGDLILDHTGVSNHESYLEVTSGNLTISGNATLQLKDTGGAVNNEHRVDADVINNLGQIDVDQHTVVTANTLDSSTGTIEFTDAQILRINGGLLKLGSASVITGNGSLNFSGSPDIDLLSQFNISAGQPSFDLSNGSVDVTGPGSLVVDAGQTFTLNLNDNIHTPVSVDGTLLVKNGSNNITGAITTAAGSQIIVDGDVNNWGDLDVSTGFVNNGDLILDHTGVSNHESYLEVTSGNLTISGNATLQLKDTGGAVNNEHTIDADIINNLGHIDVDQHTVVNANTLDTNNGTIEFTDAQTLRINGGLLKLGSSSVLTGNGTLNFTATPDIDLSSQFNISAGQPGFDLSNGNVDFTGPGSLVIDAGETLTLNLNDRIQTPVQVDGTLLVKNGNNDITGVVTTAAGSQLIVDGDANNWGVLDISTGFVSNGDLILDHTGVSNHESSLTVTSGNLTISGNATLQLKDTGGALNNEHVITAETINFGQIDVDQNTRFSASTLDNTNGTIDFTGNQILRMHGGVLKLGTGSVLSGSGSFNFTNGADIELTSQFNISAGLPSFDLSNTNVTINGAGSLVIDAGQNLTLNSSDSVQTPLTNNGSLSVFGLSNGISGALVNNTGATITVDAPSGGAQLTVSNGFTNDGTIVLDNSGTGNSSTQLTITAGNLTNSGTGVINVEDTGGGADTDFLVATQLINLGDLNVNQNLNLNKTSQSHFNDGDIAIAAGQTLTVHSSSTLTNNIPGEISGNGTLDVGSATLTNDGTIAPGNSVGTLTIDGNVTHSATAKLDVEVDNTSTPDLLIVNGNFQVDPASTIDVEFDAGLSLSGGEVFTIASATTLTVSGNMPTVNHNDLGPLLDVVAVQNGNQLELHVNSLVTGFFNNDDPGDEWTAPDNWDFDRVPLSSDVVTINGFTVGHATAAVSTVKTFILDGATNLNLSSGQIISTEDSEVRASAQINQTGGELTTDGNLTVQGTYNWADGTISGNGAVVVDGTLNVNAGASHILNTTLDLKSNLALTTDDAITGTGSINVNSGVTLSMDGSESITPSLTNLGTVTTSGTSNQLNGSFSNAASSQLTIAANGSGDSALTIASGFTNSGTILLDNTDTAGRTASLDVTAGTLLNTNIIQTTSSGGHAGGDRNLNATIDNQGTIDVDHNTTITATGNLATQNGTIDVATLKILNVSATGVTVGSSTTLLGDGEIRLNGTQTLELLSDFTIPASGPDLSFFGNVTVNGGGTFIVPNGASQNISGDTFNAALDIQNGGTFTANDGSSQINGNVTQAGDLNVEANSVTHADLTFANGFTNTGNITLDNSYTQARNATLTVTGGTLVNASGASIKSEVGGNVSGSRDINAAIDNQGTIDINQSTNITTTGNVATENGTIDVDTSKTLHISANTVKVGSATTLLGDGEVRLNGTPTLELVSDFTVPASGPNLSFYGTVTVGGTGDFIVPGGASQNISGDVFNASVDVDIQTGGTLTANDGNSQIYGNVTQAGDLDVVATSVTHATLTLANGFTNTGNITLDNGHTQSRNATLTVTSGTLVNASGASITTEVGGNVSGARDINAAIDNQGTIDINQSTNITTTGNVATESGTIDVDTGKTLFISANTVKVGSGTTLVGGGEVRLNGTPTLELVSDFTIPAAGPNLSFYGTVTVAGTGDFIVPAGAVQNISGDTFNASVDVDIQSGGTLTANDGVSQINGNVTQAGDLNIEANSVASAELTLANGFTNTGNITLDNNYATQARNATLNVTTGTLVNASGGIIKTMTSGHGSGSRTINGIIDNQGTIDIDFVTSIFANSASQQNSGTIDVAAGRTLTYSGSSSTFTNADGGKIEGAGTFDVTALTFNNDGKIVPGGDNTAGILTINHGTNTFGRTSDIDIEIGGTTVGTQYDQVAFSSVPNFSGRLKVSAINGHVFTTNSFNVITWVGALSSKFDEFEGLDVYDADGVVLDFALNASDLTLTATTPDVTGTGTVDASGGTLIRASNSNDTIQNVSSMDHVFAAGGDDIIETDNTFKRIDGGDGVDQLRLFQSIDYRFVDGYTIDNIEIIDIKDNVAQTIQLDKDAIFRLVDGNNALTSIIDSLVQLYGDFFENGIQSLTVNSVTADFHRLTHDGASIFIDPEVSLEVNRSDSSVIKFGGSGNDTVSGSSNDDILRGRDGDDTVNGLLGNDIVDGGKGADFLDGGMGSDTITGGDGDDRILYEAGDTSVMAAPASIHSLLMAQRFLSPDSTH